MFEQSFTAERMVHDYVKLYERLARPIDGLARVIEPSDAVRVPAIVESPLHN